MKNYQYLLAFCFVILLQGCATTSEKPVAPSVDVINSAPIDQATIPEAPPPSEPVAAPVIDVPTGPIPPATANAIASLVKQSRAEYDHKNYQGAVATAERALRIDRRSPEVYLILAQSYLQLANTTLAQQFVQQGIRYAKAESDIAQTLMQLKQSLLK